MPRSSGCDSAVPLADLGPRLMRRLWKDAQFLVADAAAITRPINPSIIHKQTKILIQPIHQQQQQQQHHTTHAMRLGISGAAYACSTGFPNSWMAAAHAGRAARPQLPLEVQNFLGDWVNDFRVRGRMLLRASPHHSTMPLADSISILRATSSSSNQTSNQSTTGFPNSLLGPRLPSQLNS